MNTQKYLESLLESSGHLNKYPKKFSDKHPDYGGYIKINDKIYRLSAWVKEKNGIKNLSIKATEADYDGELNTL